MGDREPYSRGKPPARMDPPYNSERAYAGYTKPGVNARGGGAVGGGARDTALHVDTANRRSADKDVPMPDVGYRDDRFRAASRRGSMEGFSGAASSSGARTPSSSVTPTVYRTHTPTTIAHSVDPRLVLAPSHCRCQLLRHVHFR